jgi:hypothetical protein
MAERSPDARSASPLAAGELEFFGGMAWPVPLSFAGAISGMRFEQGDVLYRDKAAYDALDGNFQKGATAIQVMLPQRSTRGTSADSSGDRRLVNWHSEVSIELIDLASGRSQPRVLSQGKLAMALFSGDDAWLDAEREEPPLPRPARDLQQALAQSLAAFDERKPPKAGCRFIFVVDLASDASRTKAIGVEEALRATGRVERLDLSPAEAGVEEASSFHPSLVIRALVLAKRATGEILPILRACLYGGGAAEAGEGEATNDRFSIGRHGILENLDTTPSKPSKRAKDTK